MILFSDILFLTDEIAGFCQCRDTRFESTVTVLLCTSGYIDVSYRGEMIRIAKDDIFIRVPYATQKGPFEYSDDFKFRMVNIPASLYEELMFAQMRVEPRWWQKQEYLKAHPVYHLSPKSIEFCDVYHRLMLLQLEDEQSDYRRQILMNIARTATMEVLKYLDKTLVLGELEIGRDSVNSSDYTFNAFTQILRENPHEREVQWYAKQLNITPKYLSEICKERSGKSASEWIADITVAELKHYLRDTTLPIREIAKVMEFPNASFFCQYTKKHTGMTPNKYRKEKKS